MRTNYDAILIIDPAMNSLIGHHHNWNTIIQQNLDIQGYKNKLFFSKSFDIKKYPQYHDAFCNFSYNPRFELLEKTNTDLEAQLLKHSTFFSRELSKNINEFITENTLVLCHTVTSPATLLGLSRWYTELPESLRPHLAININFFFAYPKDETIINFCRAVQPLENLPKVRLLSPIDDIIDVFKLNTRAKVIPLPFPCDLPKGESSQETPAKQNQFSGDLVFGFSGTALPQKNITLFPKAIEEYIIRGGQGRFVLQMTPMPKVESGIPQALAELSALAIHYPQKCTFIPHGIYPNSKYYQLIQSFSVALLLYDPSVFHSYRSSQVFIEMASFGKPSIVCTGSWLHDKAKKLNNGSIAIDFLNVETLIEALFEFEASAQERISKATAVGSILQKEHSIENFLRAFLDSDYKGKNKVQTARYEFDNDFSTNFLTLGNTNNTKQPAGRYLFIEPRFNYQLFTLNHPKYEYLHGQYPKLIEIANKHYHESKYTLRVSEKFAQFPKYDFSKILTITANTPQRPANGILIGTSIAPKRIEAQQAAITSWIRQGFDVVSINYQHEIDVLKSKFPEVLFIPNTLDSLQEHGKQRIYLYDIFQVLKSFSTKYNLFGLINSDISLFDIDIEKLKNTCKDFVVTSHRIDQPEETTYIYGLDAFFINRQALDTCCKEKTCYLLGETFWDYYIPLLLMSEGHKISRAIPPLCSHVSHELAWSWNDWKRFFGQIYPFFKRNFSRLKIEDFHKLYGLLTDDADPKVIADLILYIILCQPYHAKLVHMNDTKTASLHITKTPEHNKMPPKINSATTGMKPAAILGNGPSLRGFNFQDCLQEYDTFGMNAAYRYWDRINWYPSYYSCLDMVLGLSHKDEIRRLIERSEEYGIRGFLLRDNLIRALGKTGQSSKITNLDTLLKQKAPFMTSMRVTTGSHTMAWAAFLGYKDIVLLGVDANYVELVDGAQRVSSADIVLEMTKDLDSNPNYFFDDYQRKGDRYNIPNPNPDPQQAVHLCGWRELKPTLEKNRVCVINANPNSKVDAFIKSSFAEVPVMLKLERQRLESSQTKSQTAYPTFYIVTPSYNSVEYIDGVIQNIIAQSGPFSVHYHVQDGGSTDDTVKRLKTWENRLSTDPELARCKGQFIFTWDSRPDQGMYHAINRGFAKLDIPDDGIMAWCNVDDKYLPITLAAVTRAFNDAPSMQWMGGSILWMNNNILAEHTYSRQSYPRELIQNYCCDNSCWPLLHQSSIFWKGNLWKKSGPLKDYLRYAGDYELWARFAQHEDFVHFPAPLSIFTHRPEQLSRHLNEEGLSRYFAEIEDKIVPQTKRLDAARTFWEREKGSPPTGLALVRTPKGVLAIRRVILEITPQTEAFGLEQGFQLPGARAQVPIKPASPPFPTKKQKIILKIYDLFVGPFLTPERRKKSRTKPGPYFSKVKHPVNVIFKKCLTAIGPSPQ